MQVRLLHITGSEPLQIPPRVVRLEGRARGFQARLTGKTKFFSDGKHGGTAEALAAVTQFMAEWYKEHPKETTKRHKLATAPNPTKQSTLPRSLWIAGEDNLLPPGITGIYTDARKGRPRHSYRVHVPIFGEKAKTVSVYIGSGRLTEDQRVEGYWKAVAVRKKAQREYNRAKKEFEGG